MAEKGVKMKTKRIVMSKLLEQAKRIADNISSPWGEGAEYHSVFNGKAPKLDIERESTASHLDDADWKLLVEDIVHLASNPNSNTKAKGKE